MRITQVSLSFTETCNLGDYSNTKPSIELTALLDASDDVHAVIGELVTTAKAVIHEKIDEELERVDRSVKYFDGPTFDVIYSGNTNLIAIVPARSVTQLPGGFMVGSERIRSDAAKRRVAYQARMMRAKTQIFDCADGNLAELIAYATEQEQINIAEREEKKRQQEEERARQRAEWEAQQRPTEEEEDDEEFYDDDEEDSE